MKERKRGSELCKIIAVRYTAADPDNHTVEVRLNSQNCCHPSDLRAFLSNNVKHYCREDYCNGAFLPCAHTGVNRNAIVLQPTQPDSMNDRHALLPKFSSLLLIQGDN